jgi:hypothetical protein
MDSGADVAHSSTETDKGCELAVVFVHGIGSQGRGQTLKSWSEPLQELLSAIGPANGFAVDVAEAKDLTGDAAEVVLTIRRGDAKTSWRLTEARWTESFHPSPASEVLAWAARFSLRAAQRGIGTLLVQFWFVLVRLVAPILRKLFPLESGCIGVAASLVAWAIGVVIMVFGLFIWLSPYALLAGLLIVSPVLVLCAVVGLLALTMLQRAPVIGHRLTPLITGLVMSVGDAHAYRTRAVQAAAMRDLVLQRVAAACERTNNVVVVAHSQGAAIACRAFLNAPNLWPTQLVTVGAGTALLNEESSVRRWVDIGCPAWVNVWTLLDLVPAGPVGDSIGDVRSRLQETIWHHTRDGGFQATSVDGLQRLAWRPGNGPSRWSVNL